MSDRAGHRSSRLAILALVSVALGVTACSTSVSQQRSSAPPSPTRTRLSATPSASPGPTAPLTGLPTTSATARRPALGVVLSGSSGSAPVGLSAADVVYAEYAEGSTVRLVAVYQSSSAGSVGPVTSTRPTDPKLLSVLHGCIAYDGGTSGFILQLTNAKLCQLTPSSAAADYRSTTVNVSGLYSAGRVTGPAVPAFSSFASGTQQLGSGTRSATRLTVTIPGHGTQVWSYDASARLWRSTVGGATVAVTTVEVWQMPYLSIPVKHPPSTITSASVRGKGTAIVVSGSTGVTGTWYRVSSIQVPNVVDGSQQVTHPLPGRSWVILAPTGSSVSLG